MGSSVRRVHCVVLAISFRPFSPYFFLDYQVLTELAPDLEGKGGAFLAEPGRGGGALRDDIWSNQHPTLPITVPHSMRA